MCLTGTRRWLRTERMRRLLMCFLVFSAPVAQAQVNGTSMDTTLTRRDTLELNEHVVHGQLFRHDRGLAATGTMLDSTLLLNYERSGLQGVMAWVPGVQMDTRGLGGSMRLSIRGSVLRAPFGVRGVKVYWGPFPLTLADGTTPLELLDPVVVGSLDVVRSVASPVYGSAPAGLVIAELPMPLRDGPALSLGYARGSYSFDRVEATLGTQRNGRFISGGGMLQRNEGYRPQEATNKQQAFVLGGLCNDRASLTAAITLQHAYWELPGSLDSSTAANSPTTANAWSQRINAHVDKRQLFGGVHMEQRVGRKLMLRATVHGQHIGKRNPYGTSAFFSGVKDETYSAFGTRISAAGTARARNWLFGWELGVEGLYEVDDLLDSAYNSNAELIAARTDARYTVSNATPYFVVQAQVRQRLWLFAGAGVEANSYAALDRLTGLEADGPGRQSAWPHVAMRWHATHGLEMHARYAEGVSRPTIAEVWTGTMLNAGLRPEQVKEVELALHINNADTSMRASVTGYHRRIRDRIVTINDAMGIPSTTNSGKAVMYGIEAAGSLRSSTGSANGFLVQGFAGVQSLDGLSRLVEGARLRLAGVPLFTGGINAQFNARRGWRIMLGARHTGGLLTKDGSDAPLPGTTLCSARLGYEFKIARRGAVEVFLLGENLLDQRYSSWLQVNDPNARYYNPAPGRSFFGGVRVRLH